MTANEIIQLLGVLYFVFGLAFIFNKKYYKSIFKELHKSKVLLFMGGYIALVIGLVIVLNFNVWTLSKDGLITFLGWIALFKGAYLMLFPHFVTKTTKMFMNSRFLDFTMFGVLISGVLLMYLGFVF